MFWWRLARIPNPTPSQSLLEFVLDDCDEVFWVDDAPEGGAPDDGLVREDLDGAGAGGGEREGGGRGAVTRLLQRCNV